MENDAINERESEAIRRRLVVIRKLACADNQTEFARKLGIASTRWNNLERGFPLTLKVLFLIVKALPDLTTAYVTHGYLERIPTPLKRQLIALEEELFPSSPKGRRPAKSA